MNRITSALNSTGWVGLVGNVLMVWGALAASLVLLGAVGGEFGTESPGPRDAPWTPPGAFVGAVWSGLYTGMGLSLWAVNRTAPPRRSRLKAILGVLIGFCLVWPFYAFGTQSRWPGLLGNLGILALAVLATARLRPHSRLAALLVAPVAVWISIATATILDGAARFGW